MLKLWHLTVVREVIKTGSISKAAATLGRSQPALSLVIADAEALIGYKLFERANSRLHPVPEAHFFLERAEEILEKMNDLERFIKQESEQSFQIRIACMPNLSENFIPEKMAEFSATHTTAYFYMRAQTSTRVLESMASQQFDIGFAESPNRSELYSTKNFKLITVIALREDHPLAKRHILTANDLSGVPFATFLPDNHLTCQLQAAFDAAGACLNVPFYLQNAAAQYAIIESGQAVGFMSLLSAGLYKQFCGSQAARPIVFRPFLPKIHQNFSLITPNYRTLPQISRQFASYVEHSLTTILDSTKQDFQLKGADVSIEA